MLSDPEACPKLAEIKSQIPKLLWDASNLNENDIFKIGDPLNLKCPSGLRLSFDNDTFDEWDNEFTIVCSYLETFTLPKYWPKCVKACEECLPDPPLHTKLISVIPPNSIPIGGFGQYKCEDSSLGVMEVSKRLYQYIFGINYEFL